MFKLYEKQIAENIKNKIKRGLFCWVFTAVFPHVGGSRGHMIYEDFIELLHI